MPPAPSFPDLDQLTTRYSRLWEQAGSEFPATPQLSDEKRRDAEREADAAIEALQERCETMPDDDAERMGWRVELQRDLQRRMRTWSAQFGTDSFGSATWVDALASDAFFETTRRFLVEARAFDETLTPEELFQALRNLWIACTAELYLGHAPESVVLTPAVFAYSLLYPYTDNLLDAPEIDPDLKRSISERLGRRLRGEALPPRDKREAILFELVGRIESQYPRAAYPDVHRSLVAIHTAQRASLAQHDDPEDPAPLDDTELLGVSVAKGGASVLADGYLAAGTLAPADADFLFGFGATLQLMDDLQDAREDRAQGHATVFTRARDRGPLDTSACRLMNFIERVVAGGGRSERPAGRELQTLILHSCRLLVFHAVADQPELFSASFRDRIERCSPLGFEYLRDRRASLAPKLRELQDRLGDLDVVLGDVA